MGRFDLEKALAGKAPIFDGVPNSGTREQIEYIDLSVIDSDPNNFYELSGIDELASNIALCGLQQPIRVRRGENGRVIIVSGHRRRAAIELLVSEGREDLRQVPCIRQREEGSPALQKLQLIYANSDTRRMTSAEISKQAEEVESLLYQLQEEGIEFPGRMRDHVAKICQVSKTKIGNLKVIRENLNPYLKNAWTGGALAESSALRIAQEPDSVQMKLMRKYGADLYRWTEDQIAKAIERVKRPEPEQRHDEIPARQAAEQYLQQLAEENAIFLDAMRTHGYDILAQYLRKKTSRREGIEALKKGPGLSHRGGSSMEHDYQCMPQYFAIKVDPMPEVKRSWTEVYDAMAVVALERAAVTALDPEETADDWAVWSCGEDELPVESGLYWCITGPLSGGGKLLWWNSETRKWEHPGAAFELTTKVLAWMKCPDLPESISWNREGATV